MAEKITKMGRPKSDNPLSKKMQVRFTESEYAKIKKCAETNDLTIAQIVRQGALKEAETLK